MSQETGKKPIYKKWWFWVGAVVVIGIIGSMAGGKKETASAESPAAVPSAATTEKPKEEPVLAVTATALYEAYDANEVSADAQYKGKKLEVSGKVKDVEKTFGMIYVNLEGDDMFGQVTCKLENETEAASMTKGQKIVLLGVGDGKAGFPRVTDCRIKK